MSPGEHFRLKMEANNALFHNEILKHNNNKLKRERNQYKQAYQHCVDDLILLRTNNKRLEERVSKIVHENVKLQNDLFTEQLNQDESDAVIDRLERENAEQLELLKQFRKLIDYKLTLHQGSSMYREYRSKLDQLGVK